jgi:hypothetical protein
VQQQQEQKRQRVIVELEKRDNTINCLCFFTQSNKLQCAFTLTTGAVKNALKTLRRRFQAPDHWSTTEFLAGVFAMAFCLLGLAGLFGALKTKR